MKRKMFSSLVVAAAVLLLGFAPAQALVIDFAGQGLLGTGSLTYVGGDVVGIDIPIDSLLVAGAPTGDGKYDLNPGVFLNFSTATGDIEITDTAYGYGWFLQGTITDWDVTTGTGVLLFQGSGTDMKNPDFLALFGIPSGTPWEFFGFTLAAKVAGTNLVVSSTDIVNTAVPEPGTMLLLGAGLLGVGLMRRRKQTRG